MMYEKNLTEDFRLRLSKTDMDFLKELSEKRSVTVSELVRSIIAEYRRSLDTIDVLKKALDLATIEKEAKMSHGDTETHFND